MIPYCIDPNQSRFRRAIRSNYPNTVVECLDADLKYKPEVLRAMKVFRRSHPWRDDHAGLSDALIELHVRLSHAYLGRDAGRLSLMVDEHRSFVPHFRLLGPSPISTATQYSGLISLNERMSLVSYLHEFAHAIFGPCERKACTWSLNLFRRIFPNSFGRLEHCGHVVVRSRNPPTPPRPATTPPLSQPLRVGDMLNPERIDRMVEELIAYRDNLRRAPQADNAATLLPPGE